MKTTVIELRALLEGLPDDLPVEFVPITAAFLGTEFQLRVLDVHVFDERGAFALPSAPDARLTIQVAEDRSAPRFVFDDDEDNEPKADGGSS